MRAPDWLTARPIAHRGLHDPREGRIENSLSAAEAAAGAGLTIECDVQLTADCEAVVFHDDALGRLTEASGPVGEREAAALGRLALAGTRDTIPTLATFLAVVADRVPVVVEVKSRFDGSLALARRVAEVAAGMPCRVAVKSFDPDVVAALQGLAPDLPRGVVAQSSYDGAEWAHLAPEARHALANLLHVETTRPHFLSWRVGDLPAAAPHLARVLGHLPVMAWTVRDEAARRRARAHADQMVFEGFRPDL